MDPEPRPRKSSPTAPTKNSRPGGGLAKLLNEVRGIMNEADPEMVEEQKWKKPSNPAGVPVWSHNGIVCIANELKGRLRLTFPKGASLEDPKRLFNTRLDSKTVRAIDIPDGGSIDASSLGKLIRGAVALNAARARQRPK
jgi:hypothetical protein